MAASTSLCRAKRDTFHPKHTRPEKAQMFLVSAAQYMKMHELNFFLDRRVELLEGTIWEAATVSPSHCTMLMKTQTVLRRMWPNSVVASRIPLSINEYSEPEPQAFVLSPGVKICDVSKTTARAATMLVVELADIMRAFDREAKERIYASANIAEYWIVNLNARELEVLSEPQNNEYGRKTTYLENDTIAPLAAPDVKIAVADLLP